MSEPMIAAAGLTADSAGVTFAAWFPEATPAVMICALAGALLYALTSQRFRLWKQAAYGAVSFIGGIYCAGTASQIIAALINAALYHLNTHVTVSVSPAVGALVASTVSVAVLLRVLARYRKGNASGTGENNEHQ